MLTKHWSIAANSHTCPHFAASLCLCRITNLAAEPVFLDQVLLQYWFHGPLDGTLAGPSDNSTAGSAEVADVVAQVSAAQFRLTCSDASAEIGACTCRSPQQVCLRWAGLQREGSGCCDLVGVAVACTPRCCTQPWCRGLVDSHSPGTSKGG